MRALLVLSALLAAATATSLPPPNFTSRPRSCSFLPNRPPRLFAAPPRASSEELCRHITCPRAPGPCYEDSECSYGVCLPPRPRDFVPCDDHNAYTVGDVCFRGTCTGLSLHCSADIHVHDTNNQPQAVTWRDPVVSYPASLVTVTSSHRSGDIFPVGETIVTVEAVSTLNSRIGATCSFKVKVYGREDHPCARVHCTTTNVCQTRALPCEVRGIEGFCPEPEHHADGIYDLDYLYSVAGLPTPRPPRFPDYFREQRTTRCEAGQSWCEGKLKFLPVRPPGLFAAPPSFRFFDPPYEPTTRRPQPPTTTTTRASTTTRKPTTTTTRTDTTRTTARTTTTTVRTTTTTTTTTRTTTTTATPRTTTTTRTDTTRTKPPMTRTQTTTTTTRRRSCPTVRECLCKPGSHPYYDDDEQGCLRCSCVRDDDRRRSILAVDGMGAEPHQQQQLTPHLTAWVGLGSISALLTLVVIVALITVQRRRLQTAAVLARQPLPRFAVNSPFRPAEEVVAVEVQ